MKKISYLLCIVFSILTLFSCKKDTIGVDASKIIEIQENVVDMLNNLSTSGASGETIINNCIQQLLSKPEVSTASFHSPDQIVIKYKSGATGIVYLIDGAEYDNKKNIEHESKKILTKGQGEQVTITNHDVLIWDWYEGGGVYDIANDLKNLFNSYSGIGFHVDVKQYSACTLQSLSNLTQYGFVYIHTHGGVYENSHSEEVCWILTRDTVSVSTIANEDILDERYIPITIAGVTTEYVNNQEIRKFTKDGNFWAVSNKFIKKYVSGTFSSPSVVFVDACHSFDNMSLCNAFVKDKKASAYIGFINSVYPGFGHAKGMEFVTNMLQHRFSAEEAYDAIDIKIDNLHDSHSIYAFLDWYIYDIPRAELFGHFKENPTYFPEEDDSSLGQLICDDGRTYPLHSCHYSPGGSLTFLHSNADGEPSYVMAFFSLTMCNTALGNFEPLHPSTTEEWMYFNSNKPLGFWVKNSCSDVSSRLSIAGGGSIKMTDGEVLYNGATGFSFWFIDETGHRWEGTYNGPIS